MSNSTPVKNGLISAGVQMMSGWLVKDGCDFVKVWFGLLGLSGVSSHVFCHMVVMQCCF